ncbi:DUF2867 domain-containing protein [Paucibacter soli]|uniref:DUF2867 domain-containing protein n=1 Tax=Paucibacter soli TaxID=3133433 RepID=UPI0030A0B997
MKVCKIPVPAASVLAASLHNADFADCYLLPDPEPRHGVLQSYLSFSALTPGWMNALMAMRNRVVALFGLKQLGSLPPQQRDKPAEAYRIGDRIGIFTLEELHPEELVIGDNDRHLHVRLSLLRLAQPDGSTRLALSTVVHEHNRLGRIYMWVVGPAHSLIVPLMLRQVIRAQQR